MAPVEPFHYELVSSCNLLQVVGVIELLRNVLPERVPSATWGNSPPTAVVGVWPEQVANGALVWHFLDSIELVDIIKGFDVGWEAAMQAKYLIFHHCWQRQVIEEFDKSVPDIGTAVLALALIIEAVHLCDLPSFVVTSKDSESISESDFECNEQGDSFNWVVAPINVITHEQVISQRHLASNVEQLN